MTEQHAELRDVFYSIGGGSNFINQLGGESGESEAMPTLTVQVDLQEPEQLVNASAVALPEPGAQIAPPLVLPWYRRLWNLLNMDVRDIWEMLLKKRL